MMSRTRKFPVVPIDEASSGASSQLGPRVLVVDDESVIADTLTEILARSGYAAVAAYDGAGALETALLMPPALLITDVVLPGMSGIELAIQMRRIYPDCKALLFSGQACTSDMLASANRLGHQFTLLNKPVHPKDLLAWVVQSLKPANVPASALPD